MFWAIFSWITSFFYAPSQLLITESPKSYMDRIFAQVKGEYKLWYSDGYLYFDVLPAFYEAEYSVPLDMSDIVLDNSIAKINVAYYSINEPEWPTFIRKTAPYYYWTEPLLMYFSELL